MSDRSARSNDTEGLPPMPGSVEMRLRGRPSDVDELVAVLSPVVPITAAPREHYRDDGGKTIRRFVTVKPLHPGFDDDDRPTAATPITDELRALLVEIARHDVAGFELFATAVRLADEMPHDEGRAVCRDRFLDALTNLPKEDGS